MARIVFDGYTRLWFLTACANPAAPTVEEIAAGVELTNYVTKDGIDPAMSDNTVPTAGIGSAFDTEVLGNRIITVGLLNHSLVHPREVFADAIVDRAASIICVHNHPSGESSPSEADIKVTRDLIRAGQLLKLEVLDHVIVTGGGHASFKEKNLL